MIISHTNEANDPPIMTPREGFWLGLKEALALPAWVLFASMLGFGSLALESGLPMSIAMASTATIWALPAQIAMAELYAVGAPVLAIILAVSMANMRFLPMTLPLVPLLRGHDLGWRCRYLLVHLLSVSTWAATLSRAPKLPAHARAPYYFGFAITCISCSIIGTGVGYAISGLLPLYLTAGLIFLNPSYFLFVFATVRHRCFILSLLIGSILGPIFYGLSPEWSLPICGLVAGTAGFGLDHLLGARLGK